MAAGTWARISSLGGRLERKGHGKNMRPARTHLQGPVTKKGLLSALSHLVRILRLLETTPPLWKLEFNI